MKKAYRIILLSIVFIFLSSYNPNEFNLNFENKNTFFKIKNIKIVNNILINKKEVESKLTKIYNQNIFFLEKQEIKDSLTEITFLDKIEVKKKYPSTIIVKIFETKPIAILFKNKEKYLLDNSSNLIVLKNNTNFNGLPNVFGEGSENSYVEFLKLLEANNFPKEKVKNFYYFQIGRWDLELFDNKTIKFPNKINNEIIKKSMNLLNRKDFENYNIIDLRVADKIIVE